MSASLTASDASGHAICGCICVCVCVSVCVFTIKNLLYKCSALVNIYTQLKSEVSICVQHIIQVN